MEIVEELEIRIKEKFEVVKIEMEKVKEDLRKGLKRN